MATWVGPWLVTVCSDVDLITIGVDYSNNVSNLMIESTGNQFDGYGDNDYGNGNNNGVYMNVNQGYDDNNQAGYGGYEDFGGYGGFEEGNRFV